MTDARIDADDIVARTRAAYGPDGRLPLGEVASWDLFPYEGTFVTRTLDDPVLPEPPRMGVDPTECRGCLEGDDLHLWTNDRWRLKRVEDCNAIPVYLFSPRAHLDLGELDETLAAEFGVLTVRIERALGSVPGVARVHINRWGDGGHHGHVWFWARPAGMLQLRGACLPLWEDAMPALPEDVLDAIDAHVAAALTAAAAPA